MSWTYDSGGHKKDQKKYAENYDKIFKSEDVCSQCGLKRIQGHKDDCPNHWRNK